MMQSLLLYILMLITFCPFVLSMDGAYIEYALFSGNNCSQPYFKKTDTLECNKYTNSSLSIICESPTVLHIISNIVNNDLVFKTYPLIETKKCYEIVERNESIYILSIITLEPILPDTMVLFFGVFIIQCIGAIVFILKEMEPKSKEKVFENMIDHMSQYINFVRSGGKTNK